MAGAAAGAVDDARRAYEEARAGADASDADRDLTCTALAELPDARSRLAALVRGVSLSARLLWHHLVFYGFRTPPES